MAIATTAAISPTSGAAAHVGGASGGPSFGALLEARTSRVAVGVPAESSPARIGAAASRALEGIEAAQGRLDRLLSAARSGRTFTAQELMALQGEAYRYSQTVQLSAKLVEQGAQRFRRAHLILCAGGTADLPGRPQSPAGAVGLASAIVGRAVAAQEVPGLEAAIGQLHPLQEGQRLQRLPVMTGASQGCCRKRHVAWPGIVPARRCPCRNGTIRFRELVKVKQSGPHHLLRARGRAGHGPLGQPGGIGAGTRRDRPGHVLGGSPAGTVEQSRLQIRAGGCAGGDQGKTDHHTAQCCD